MMVFKGLSFCKYNKYYISGYRAKKKINGIVEYFLDYRLTDNVI